MQRFIATNPYREEAFLIDEVVRLDAEERSIEARMQTTRYLPFSSLQRIDAHHPAHVAAAEILMLTGNLGFLHAWFFHGCRWDEGWSGFGNRIHRADFKRLAHIGPPLELRSKETRTRTGTRRVVMRCQFEFRQEETLVYSGDQTAMFFRDRDFSKPG
jgi:hypothetical protein